jgi:hypothetical protein
MPLVDLKREEIEALRSFAVAVDPEWDGDSARLFVRDDDPHSASPKETPSS